MGISIIEEQAKRRLAELEERRLELQDLVCDINEKERDKVRRKASKDFFYFAKKVFPEYCTYDFSILHKDIFRFATTYQRLVHVIAGPPEHGKTVLLRLFKIWCAIYGKRHYIIKITETMGLSLIDLASIRIEFESNKRLIFLYGNLKTTGLWDEDAFKVAKTDFNKYGCWFEAFAYGVPPTGRVREQFRPDFCDIDDLENYKKSGNIEISKEKLEFINNDIIPRLASDAPIIWFGNNARKTMAMNIIIEMDEQERERDFPAFRIHTYPAFDRVTKKALWIERYNYDDEEKMRLAFGVGMMTWCGNYMQMPVVADGLEFKKDDWRTYTELPKDALGIIMADPASGQSGCYKALAVLFFSRETLKFYSPECFCQQCDWEKYFIAMYDLYARYQKHIRFIGWEEDFHQDQYILFRRLYVSVKHKPELPIKPITVKGEGKKEERIRSLSVPFENGNIIFHKDFLGGKDGLEAQTQLIGFPDYSYKDFPDALATAYRQVFNMFAGVMYSREGKEANLYESIEKRRTDRNLMR